MKTGRSRGENSSPDQITPRMNAIDERSVNLDVSADRSDAMDDGDDEDMNNNYLVGKAPASWAETQDTSEDVVSSAGRSGGTNRTGCSLPSCSCMSVVLNAHSLVNNMTCTSL
ncbi:hypothetical protein PC110_g23348, partial [Phytophthora cactorum]